MSFADILRTANASMEDVADLLESVFGASSPLVVHDFTPTFSCNGSMTISGSPTIYQAKYFELGSVVVFWICAQLTLAGTANTQVLFSLPVTMINTPIGFWSGNSDINSAGRAGWNSTTQGLVELHGGSNWTLGASRNVNVGGLYIKQ